MNFEVSLTTKKQISPIVLIVGTRPEGIKMIPLYKALKKANLPTILCSTMQHDELLYQVFDAFDVIPDFNLEIMRQGQDLFYLTNSILQKTKELFTKIKPSLVIVQGDTTSTMAAALSAFYLNIPIAHVEAGLRTDDIMQPFPEEANRRIVTQIAKYNFAPTEIAAKNLVSENVSPTNIFITGNTVTDALRIIQEKFTQNIKENNKELISPEIKKIITKCKLENKTIILLTAHRRESFIPDQNGTNGISKILKTMQKILQQHPNTFCIYPFHPNPNVIQEIEKTNISNLENIYLCEPISYSNMVYVITNSDLILTDSGGIQEEAIALSKPVLVLREKTERMEGVLSGLAKIVGTDAIKIEKYLKEYINFKTEKSHLNTVLSSALSSALSTGANNIYGDGYASEKITEIIKQEINKNNIKTQETKKLNTNNVYDINNLNNKILVKTGSLDMYQKENNILNKVCMIGLGYIGLPTSIILAENGLSVTGFDIDAKRVESINSGDPVIEEPEIYEKLHVTLSSGKFKASTQIEPADYFIIAVPTPFKENNLADLSYVDSAANYICTVLQKGNTVLLESTVPVGATDSLARTIEEKTKLVAGQDFYVAHCPERVLPGKIFQELEQNDRVIGGINQESAYKSSLLYKTFVKGQIYLTDSKTAEMVKLVENSSRDVQIAFAHQVASMAKDAGLDANEIIELANKHPRVNILQPTCGVGGHCIAIDPWFLVESFPNSCNLIKSARQVNDNRPLEVINIITEKINTWELENKKACSESCKNSHCTNGNNTCDKTCTNMCDKICSKICNVLILGLTYKADVDDLRESPALKIAKELSNNKNINLLVSEPNIRQQKLKNLFDAQAISTQEGIEKADIIIYLVGHKRFKAIDQKILKNKIILDFCGITNKPRINNLHTNIFNTNTNTLNNDKIIFYEKNKE